MAKRQPTARKESRSKRDDKEEPESGTGRNGQEGEAASYEKELAAYLQERIKPNLNSGAIPLLARSIAKEIAHREQAQGASEDAEADDEPSAESDDEPTAEAGDEGPSAEADEESDDEESDDEADDEEPSDEADDDEPSAESETPPDFEDEMHELQAELGDAWILRFSVQGENAWLTAETEDGSQRVEAPTAEVLAEAVALLNEGGGRSGST
jgi:hypothetical protein